MSEPAHVDQAPIVNRWDAPSAVEAAIRAAGPSPHILAADFALRLGRLGHVREISVTVASGPEAAEAVRSVLAEMAAYDRVFVAYGLLALVGLAIVLVPMGPLTRDESLE
jgi:hypothetical protein